jgi:hypothetical protein
VLSSIVVSKLGQWKEHCSIYYPLHSFHNGFHIKRENHGE